MNRRHVNFSRAFTLLELMIVIGIIVLLLAILMPAVGKIRFQAQCTLCASNLRQLAAACSHYATDNNGWLPEQKLPASAGNASDVSIDFYNMMAGRYKVPEKMMYCPLLDQTLVDGQFNYDLTATGSVITTKPKDLGYDVWIPRPVGGTFIPPLQPGYTTGLPYTYPMPLDNTPFTGPQKITDTANPNPIFTDIVASSLPVPASTARANAVGNPYRFISLTNHQWRGQLQLMNAAFADGHVEAIDASAIRPCYGSNQFTWWH